MLLTAVWQLDAGGHPFAHAGWMAWLLAVAVFYGVLYRQQRDEIAVMPNAQHIAITWLICGLLIWELGWQLNNLGWGSSWRMAVWGAVPAAAILFIVTLGRARWPWRDHFALFRLNALTPLVVLGVLWSLMALGDPARVQPMPYVPLLNAIDLTQALVLWAIWCWLTSGEHAEHDVLWQYRKHVVSIAAFLWVNAIVLRTIHHWTGVAYQFSALFHSVTVQTSFSLLWTTTAFALMVTASRKRYRYLWFTGAALLSVVVAKLFLFDLANTGTIARIVSFMGVGGLLMWIGYKVPVPPGDVEAEHG
jgi:uncharacterized membrane protein